ncbi:hypothetical protein [Pseudomonas sp. dw_612]|uniref:DUF6124 family protein n=1 Tax=Pseudomonas sp. dw_612 TaxID=2720080 RepID=UPI001BD281D4|nr:hypothetical protein [Pseudomonas sp. dw_612]
MKKPRLTLIKNPNFSGSDALDLKQLTAVADHYRNAWLSDPRRSDPTRTIFAVNPDIDAPTLLAHASQNLASLKSVSADFIAQLDGPQRSKAWAIQRLIVFAELLVNQARENIGSPGSKNEPVHH